MAEMVEAVRQGIIPKAMDRLEQRRPLHLQAASGPPFVVRYGDFLGKERVGYLGEVPKLGGACPLFEWPDGRREEQRCPKVELGDFGLSP